MANSLRGEDGRELVKAVRIASSSPPVGKAPHLIVCTPAGLISAAREFKDAYGAAWSQEGIIERSAAVFQNQTEK